ncbi:hypothetical protein K492DRAFT_200748 [Lichtheimia hyalospora FSU 10163]|nr:hypothetical protein K492DRAFT_200748 [Lichtheimia hyalospora FSU 10163]
MNMKVTPRERVDFERYYLKLCTKDGNTQQEIARLHPRSGECVKHDFGGKKTAEKPIKERVLGTMKISDFDK